MLFAVGAPAIATRWLSFSTLSAGEVRGALGLMGVALPAIVVRGVYLAGLNGLQRQALANLLQTGGTTVRAARCRSPRCSSSRRRPRVFFVRADDVLF